MKKNPGRRERIKHTTQSFIDLPSLGSKGNIGIGLRHGNNGQRQGLKADRDRKSTRKMRTHLGMVKSK